MIKIGTMFSCLLTLWSVDVLLITDDRMDDEDADELILKIWPLISPVERVTVGC